MGTIFKKKKSNLCSNVSQILFDLQAVYWDHQELAEIQMHHLSSSIIYSL